MLTLQSIEEKEMAKVNCWEHKKCGWQPGGGRISELGVCPASMKKRVDGIHGGVRGGRCCYMIAGTFAKERFKACMLKNCQAAGIVISSNS